MFSNFSMNPLGFKCCFSPFSSYGQKTLKIHPFSCFIYFISRFPNKKIVMWVPTTKIRPFGPNLAVLTFIGCKQLNPKTNHQTSKIFFINFHFRSRLQVTPKFFEYKVDLFNLILRSSFIVEFRLITKFLKKCNWNQIQIFGLFEGGSSHNKVIRQEKLFQRRTYLLYCSVLSLGGKVNPRRMSQLDMGSIFNIKIQ